MDPQRSKTAREADAYAPRRVRDIPSRLRPREEMERVGAANVSDDVLLAIVLRSGVRGHNVVDLARHLLNTHGSLTSLAGASVDDLAAVKGMGRVKAQVLAATLELARRLSQETVGRRHVVRSPEDVAALLREHARTLDREVFWVLPLDAKNQLKSQPVVVSEGLLDASLVHPREVYRPAISCGSAAVIVAHNHPSGDPTPSAEDIAITRQLVDAGKVIGIRLLDHVVLGKPATGGSREHVSLREAGLADFG